MKISKIEIQNFKAFKEAQSFDIDNKNILVFGTNGSGKSSLYYSLHSFLQSSIKTDEQRTKYFVYDGTESLLNIHAVEGFPSYIKISIDNNTTYEFSPIPAPGNIDNKGDVIKLANESSDFMNYRFMLAFSSFRNSEDANIFPIVRNEFFPFWNNEAGINYQEWYDSLLNGINVQREAYRTGTTSFKRNFWTKNGALNRYKAQLESFNDSLRAKFLGYIETINDLMREYFLKMDDIKVFFDLSSYKPLRIEDDTWSGIWHLVEPELVLKITKGGKPIPKPHVFLNEARLTGLALSMRMAIFEQRYKGTGDFKILVLDDLLLSLDMSKRMEVINFILNSDKFTNYQLFIFTHDKGFYNILRNNLITNEHDWKCFEFYENNNPTAYKNPIVIESLDSLKKAEMLLNGDPTATPPIPPKYDECALYLRKKAEELIKIFYDPTLENISRFDILKKLANSINGMENEFDRKVRKSFSDLLDDETIMTEDTIKRLRADPYINNSLSKEEKLKTNALKFRMLKIVDEFRKRKLEISGQKISLINKCKEVNELRSRILNHGAHPTSEPLFGGELIQAVKTIEELQQEVGDCLEWFKTFENDILKFNP
jgi:energy-coupling factor transporter ATP-binding protein EcfA2